MFANFLNLLNRNRPAEDYRNAFVEEVNAPFPREARSQRSERLLVACWILIAGKCWAIYWLVSAYNVPVNPWWINGPTLAAAAVCTAVYLRRP